MTNPIAAGTASLMHGWLPVTVQVVTIAVVGWSLFGRPRLWYVRWMAAVAVIGVVAAWAAHRYMEHLGIASEPAPWQLWCWVALCAAAGAVVIAGWPGSGWFQRNLTVFATSLCLLSTGLTINGWIGYFPTVWTAWNQLTGGPLPGQTDWPTVAAMQTKGLVPRSGALVKVTIGANSNFSHRDEWVYLPPAWFASKPPPRLPAVMLVGGEFHTTADWARAGDAVATLNDFAAGHGGYAPVAVFVDSGGAFTTDTECVNGPRGNAADHLTGDIVPYLISTFGVSALQRNWGVAGFSSGGTCALDLAAMHPELFHAFVDIAGDQSPNAGTKEQTIDRLFGGDEKAWQAFDPATVITTHGSYRNVSGLIVAPGGPTHRSSPGDEALCALGRAHEMSCDVVMVSGRHDWPFAADVFARTLPWLAGQLRTPAVPLIGPPRPTPDFDQ
jgi:S-formylglutathione hydrolase FrmB